MGGAHHVMERWEAVDGNCRRRHTEKPGPLDEDGDRASPVLRLLIW